jgi:hypothetical protein
MTARTLLLTASLIAGSTAASAFQPPRSSAPPPSASDQQQNRSTPAAPTPAPAIARKEQARGLPVNVKVQLTITDQRPDAAPIKKTVVVVVADGEVGSVRSESQYMNVGSAPLNVDAKPEIVSDGKIRVGINVQYDLAPTKEALADLKTGTPTGTKMHESLYVVVDTGKPLVIAQSADPGSDRQVTLEVIATIMK